MDIGKAFDSLRKSSAALGVEYFTISQLTLGQVFIRTVKAHTAKKKGEAVEESPEEADGVAIIGFVVICRLLKIGTFGCIYSRYYDDGDV